MIDILNERFVLIKIVNGVWDIEILSEWVKNVGRCMCQGLSIVKDMNKT